MDGLAASSLDPVLQSEPRVRSEALPAKLRQELKETDVPLARGGVVVEEFAGYFRKSNGLSA